MKMKTITVSAKIENLGKVQAFVHANIAGCANSTQSKVRITVDEIFSNIAKYSYDNKRGDVIVRVLTNGDIMLEFEDVGVPFNPLDTEEPDIKQPPQQRELGGLGIYIVKNIMQAVKYRREGNKNILTITI